MAIYLTRFSYTPETWARMIENPEDRREAARTYIESVGGKLHGFWYAFGEHDGWNLWEAPDNVSMAAVALAIGAGGALSSIETTVLLSVEDTMEALKKAKSIRYRPPGRRRGHCFRCELMTSASRSVLQGPPNCGYRCGES
ncbi:uncharacterized protein with GYD domain [Sinorhizobium fredii]